MICAHCGNKPEQQPCEYCGKNPLLVGRLSYRLDEILGRGAKGVTYRGMELSESWPVAVKELPLHPLVADKEIQLAHRETAVLQQLDHPAIPKYIDHVATGEGKHRSLFIVTSLVHGLTLQQEMERKRYDEDEVLSILEELLGILQYLHELSPPVIHRDLKPSNIMRRQPGNRLVLVDFGAVRDALKDPELGGSTVAGTFGYMAPEQFAGDSSPKSDLYGLGALAVALLSRQEPHKLHDPSGRIAWEKALSARPSTRLLLTGLLLPEARLRLDHDQARQLIASARKERRGDAEPRLPAPKPRSSAKRGSGRVAAAPKTGRRPSPRPKAKTGARSNRGLLEEPYDPQEVGPYSGSALMGTRSTGVWAVVGVFLFFLLAMPCVLATGAYFVIAGEPAAIVQPAPLEELVPPVPPTPPVPPVAPAPTPTPEPAHGGGHGGEHNGGGHR